jgi:hypothetical protein
LPLTAPKKARASAHCKLHYQPSNRDIGTYRKRIPTPGDGKAINAAQDSDRPNGERFAEAKQITENWATKKPRTDEGARLCFTNTGGDSRHPNLSGKWQRRKMNQLLYWHDKNLSEFFHQRKAA